MSPEKEAKENILTLRAGNALLDIIPEVGGSTLIIVWLLKSKLSIFCVLLPMQG